MFIQAGERAADDFLGGGDNRPESFPVCCCAAGVPHTCSRTPANWSFSTCSGTPSELATFLRFTALTVPDLMPLHRKGDTTVR